MYHTPRIAAFILEKSARKTEYIFEIYRSRGTFWYINRNRNNSRFWDTQIGFENRLFFFHWVPKWAKSDKILLNDSQNRFGYLRIGGRYDSKSLCQNRLRIAWGFNWVTLVQKWAKSDNILLNDSQTQFWYLRIGSRYGFDVYVKMFPWTCRFQKCIQFFWRIFLE